MSATTNAALQTAEQYAATHLRELAGEILAHRAAGKAGYPQTGRMSELAGLCRAVNAHDSAAGRAVSLVSEAALKAAAAPAAAQPDLLGWLWENACDVRCESSGDDDVHWTVVEHHMAAPTVRVIGHGLTPADAIRDAMLPAGDPRRWDYVPPEPGAAAPAGEQSA